MPEIIEGVPYDFECTECGDDFNSVYKVDGYLPDCPHCGIDYRVYRKEDAN